MTQRTAYLLAAGLMLASCIATHASEPKLVQKTYPVADLVLGEWEMPTTSGNVNPPAPTCPRPATLAPLMKLIVASVAPHSWTAAGGKATIDYSPLDTALVVSQTTKVHEQIAALLESLRRNTGKEVGVEIRVVSIGEEMAKELQAKHDIDCFRCAEDKDQSAEPQVSFLNDIELFQLMEMLQGDRHSDVIQHPKLTLLNGQTATSQVMDNQWLVNNVQVVEQGGQVVFVPENKPIPFGWNFCVQPVVSGDEKTIRLQLDLQFSTISSFTVPLFPITTFVTPVFEGGAQGQPIPFTQFIQQPCLSTWSLNEVVNVPTGSTAVLSGWKVEREARWEGPPVLSKIPYVKDLFRLFTTCREPRYILVLVTPRLVENCDTNQTAKVSEAKPEPETLRLSWNDPVLQAALAAPCMWLGGYCQNMPYGYWNWPTTVPANVDAAVQPVKYEAPAPKPEADFLGEVRKEMAELLVRKYHQACQQGLTTEAKCIAEEALELDPACFSKAGAK